MASKSDFVAAQEIKAILDGREKGEQERILRWVSESIGVAPSLAAGNAPTQQTGHSITTPSPNPAQHVHRRDIKSFVTEKAPKSDIQFAVVTAYFYSFEVSAAERKSVIVPQDLQEAGRQARGYGFKNALTTLNNAVAQGYFDRGGRGEFKLNAVGENLVAMALPGTTPVGAKVVRAKKKKASAGIKAKRKKK